MSLLQHLTLSRGIILGSFLGSGVVGWLLYREQQRLADLQLAVDEAQNRVPVLVNKAQELEGLIKATAREDFGSSVQALESYIVQRAADPKVSLGQVEISKPNEQVIQTARKDAPGVRDLVYKITPASSAKGEYSRGEISNFLYLLEQDSRRVKVTGLTMTPTDKGAKVDRLLSDRWKYDVELRVREKFEAPKAN
jgi:hypothetical protein